MPTFDLKTKLSENCSPGSGGDWRILSITPFNIDTDDIVVDGTNVNIPSAPSGGSPFDLSSYQLSDDPTVTVPDYEAVWVFQYQITVAGCGSASHILTVEIGQNISAVFGPTIAACSPTGTDIDFGELWSQWENETGATIYETPGNHWRITLVPGFVSLPFTVFYGGLGNSGSQVISSIPTTLNNGSVGDPTTLTVNAPSVTSSVTGVWQFAYNQNNSCSNQDLFLNFNVQTTIDITNAQADKACFTSGSTINIGSLVDIWETLSGVDMTDTTNDWTLESVPSGLPNPFTVSIAGIGGSPFSVNPGSLPYTFTGTSGEVAAGDMDVTVPTTIEGVYRFEKVLNTGTCGTTTVRISIDVRRTPTTASATLTGCLEAPQLFE